MQGNQSSVSQELILRKHFKRMSPGKVKIVASLIFKPAVEIHFAHCFDAVIDHLFFHD